MNLGDTAGIYYAEANPSSRGNRGGRELIRKLRCEFLLNLRIHNIVILYALQYHLETLLPPHLT